MSTQRSVISFAVGLLLASHVDAGIPDTPLPTFADGKPAQLVYSLPFLTKNNDLESVVICTSLASAAIDVGLEAFDQAGIPANSIAAGNGALINVAPGQTVTIATGATAVFHEDLLLAITPGTTLANGSGRIVATSPSLACVGFGVDSLHPIADPAICPGCKAPPITNLVLSSPCTPGGCDDGNACTVDDCSETGGCVHTPVADGSTCDDGNACTTPDGCREGLCRGDAVVCGADTPCRLGAVCQPATGECVDTDPFSTCAPGGGGAKTDCAGEWVVDNPGNAKGIRSNAHTCRQGDATCDHDVDPAQCTFHLRACLNAQDLELPTCSPTTVSTYDLRRPTPAAKRASDRVAATNILTAVGALGPSTAEGKRASRLAFDPAVSTADRCTPVVEVSVPLKKSLSVRTILAPSSGAKDRDRLKLKCTRP